MATFILPFYESQRGWYEIEANTLEEAKALVEDNDYISDLEPNYKDGQTDWDPEEITEATDTPWYREEN